MNTNTINETWRRVILMPEGTTYTDVYLAVSGRPDKGVVLGMNQQYSLFSSLCDLAALCEGGAMLMDGKAIKPEQYLREWRALFNDAKPVTDHRNSDLLIDAKLIVDPSQFAGDDGRYRRESLQALQAEHPFSEVNGRIEFSFDLANPAHAKRLYDYQRLHFDPDGFPVTVATRDPRAQEVAQPSLFGEMPA